ncbi:MAG: PA14 domain-containing protein [Anaerolineales bacterium]|nr:PA14 domain-containing protein [Anaerolineales bacterium]
MPRLLLILGVFGFCIAGQFMLRADQPLIGAIFIVLAALFFVVIFRDQPGPGNWLTTETLGRQLFKLNWWGGISLVLAILFAALAFWLFGEDIPEYFPWLAHRISIGLLIFSSFWLNKSTGISESQSNNKKWNWLEVGIFLAILVIAAFMRLYRLDQIPFGLWYDEADNGLSALAILNQSEYLPVFVKSTNLPAHFLYLIVFFFKILGVSVLTIRTLSVAFGMATVVVSFFLGNELFDRRLGLVFAFFIAVSRWDVNWSRIGMHGVTVPFFEILSAVLILWALRKQNLAIYTLAGLSLGLGLCFYTPLYFFPFVIGAFLLFLWLHRHDLFFSSWRGFLFLALAAIIVSVPISQFALRQTDTFSNRLHVTSIFTGKSTQEAWTAIAQTTREHLLMFNYRGDKNGRHNLPGEPMLDPISGAFMSLGLALSLWRIRQPGAFLLIAWLLIMLTPGVFSLDFESPQSLRAIGSLPPAYLLAVIPVHALWQEWEQFHGKRSLVVFILPLIFVLGIMGYINYHIYFDLQSKRSDVWAVFSTPETIIGKTMAELDPQVVDIYLDVFYYYSPTMDFLAPDVDITEYQPLYSYATLPILGDSEKIKVLFVEADRRPFFLQARHYYPNADFKEYKAPDGNVVLYQITLNPSDIAASQGITASYYRNADWQAQPFLVTKESTINVDWKDGSPSQFPFGVKWQGVLYAEHYGFYRFTLLSPSPAELYLDNVQIYLEQDGEGVQTVEVELAKGSHDLVLKALGKEGHFELDWQPPGEKQALIPSSHLFLPPISNNGLLGYYFANGDWQSPPALIQVDPWIHFNYYTKPLPAPYTVEWVGRINITEGGDYGFSLESIDESALFIDDEQITSGDKEGEARLSPGFHLIRIRYANRTAYYTRIKLYWAPPGSGWESIPQEALFLP